MSLFDDESPQKPKSAQVIVGEDLSQLSENDLEERIAALEAEISRTQEILKTRSNIRNEAESVFGKSSS